MTSQLEAMGLGGQRVYNVDNPADRLALRNQSALPQYPEIIPRNYEARPVGSFVPAVDTEAPDILVRKEEYQDAIEYAHEMQVFPSYAQKNSWAPDGFRYNQNGLGYCTTSDTEVLTETGWVLWPDYNGTDPLGTVNPVTQQLEFQYPLELQRFEYDGEMIYSTNRRIDFGVTPNHRMYVRKWDERQRTLASHYQFTTAENLGWYCGLMHSPSGWVGVDVKRLQVPDDREYDGDDFVKLVSLIVSDGFAGGIENRKTKNLVSFACFDELRHQEMDDLARRCGFSEQPSRRGVWQRWDAGALATWLRKHCYTGEAGAANKRIPQFVQELSAGQIELFLRYYHDQAHKRPLSAFYTTSQSVVDGLQVLLMKIGKRSTPSWKYTGPNLPLCTLVVSDTDRLCIDRKKHIEREHYEGEVFCATVPNSTLVTRRNGSVLISGNCWTWGGTACLMDLQQIHAVDVIKLAPVSMGYLVGWANRGNYLESYLRGAREQGVCEASNGWNINDHRNNRSVWEGKPRPVKLDRVWDIDTRSGKERALQILLSCLVYGCPCYIAYNWWGHALEMVSLAWDQEKPYDVIFVIRNSHNEDDFILLEGSKGIPDEMYAFVSLKLNA